MHLRRSYATIEPENHTGRDIKNDRKTHAVPNGVIHYWMNDFQPGRAVLVFLPGLTADHRLFDKQVEAFESTYNLLAWDAPGHGKSRPL